MPAGLINRSGCFALLAAVATLSFGAAAIAADDAPTPAIEKTGDWRAAADEWSRLGCPYDQGLALLAGDEAALREDHDADGLRRQYGAVTGPGWS